MLVALALLLAQVAPHPETDVVVRVQRSGDALAACLAKGCSTQDDVRLSMAHAEAQFAQGEYYRARRTLYAALSRQKGVAPTYPRMVSALYEASATVNLHMADIDGYRTAFIGQNRTLRENLPGNDPQVLLTNILQGDMWTKVGQSREARRLYNKAARDYMTHGDERLAALSQLRAVALDISLFNFHEAEARLIKVDAAPATDDPIVRMQRAILRARLASARGDESRIDDLLAMLRTNPAEPPVLIRGDLPVPPLQQARRTSARIGDLTTVGLLRNTESARLLWADIGFMVMPDGTVADVEFLRGTRLIGWINPHIAAIGKRRYAPLDLPAGHPGLYRVERYTEAGEIGASTGSLARRSSGPRRLEIIDMTRDDALTPPSAINES